MAASTNPADPCLSSVLQYRHLRGAIKNRFLSSVQTSHSLHIHHGGCGLSWGSGRDEKVLFPICLETQALSMEVQC